jgi:hypothetical protein
VSTDLISLAINREIPHNTIKKGTGDFAANEVGKETVG